MCNNVREAKGREDFKAVNMSETSSKMTIEKC